MRRKRCKYCNDLFFPDARVGHRQKACPKSECQKKRKRDSQKAWQKKNPEYFQGQYAKTKQWLDDHPDYLKHYRGTHPEYVEKNRKLQNARDQARLDIQDSIDVGA